MSHEAAPSATAEQSVEQVDSPYVEKAQAWKDRINTNDAQRIVAQEELDGLQAQLAESRDHARIRTLEKTLRHADKEQSVINAELHQAPDNLMRAERQVFENFIKGVEGNVVSSPEKLIAGFDDKRASLTESIAELRDEIRSKQRAYGLNTIKAHEHKELGPKMKKLNKQNDQLRQLNDAWISIDGEKVDAAREMVAVKEAYDNLPVNEGLAEIRSSQNQEEETPESVDDVQVSSPNDFTTGSYQLELEAPTQNRERHPDPVAETQAIGDLLNDPNIASEVRDAARRDLERIAGNIDRPLSAPIDNLDGESEMEEIDTDKVDRLVDVSNRLEEWLNTRENRQVVAEMRKAREEFVSIMAKNEKNHNRYRPKAGGFVDQTLRLGGLGRVAEWLQRAKPTKKERLAGEAYAEALAKVDSLQHNFLGHEYDNGNMTKEEIRGRRAQFFSATFAQDTLAKAQIQKINSKKPMNKWLGEAMWL